MKSARSLNSQRPAGGDKRTAIIRAAISVFAHNGYFNSKVADIAREAGVADGTVYLYFKSKEEILHSIFDRSVDEAVADARKQLDAISDPREKLRRIARLHQIHGRVFRRRFRRIFGAYPLGFRGGTASGCIPC